MNPAASRMVHITAVMNDWKPLQLFEEGNSYFVEHLPMVASERIKFFTQSKNKVAISEAFISSCSYFLSNQKRM